MKFNTGIMFMGMLLCLARPAAAGGRPAEYVILLHGLARTERSMKALEKRLVAEGYGVVNVGYPSRSAAIQNLAGLVIPDAVAACVADGAEAVHFVTHSMGGILARYYLARHHLPQLGRVVMLAPPNAGSRVVDKLRGNFIFKWLNGPAGQQLGTGPDSLPKSMGPVNYEVGVIAGDRSVNFLLSRLIAGPDDGKVAVAATRVEGMADHIVIHATHPFIMRHRQVMDQVVMFLKNGRFAR